MIMKLMKMKMTMLIALYLLNSKPLPVCFSNCVNFLHIKWQLLCFSDILRFLHVKLLLNCIGNLGIVFEHDITIVAYVHNDADTDNDKEVDENENEDDNVDCIVSAKLKTLAGMFL